METGDYFVGIVVGVASNPWQRGESSGINHTLGLASVFVDKYGQETRDTVDLDIAPDVFHAISEQATKYKGMKVIVPFRILAKNGPKGPFSRRYIPRGSSLKPLKD